ncbi:MAG: hypothetical protein IPL35_08215 [Sphingobacteriales bacterium]|nr:hypothetical protein [Sphingobacteriales bacterium]
MKNVLLLCCLLLLSFCSPPLTAQRLKWDTLRVEQIYNDTAYQRYIPHIEGENWTAAHDSLLQYYAQEADYIFETDSTEDIINLQTPQGIFAFVTKSLSKSLKGDLKAGNVELIMQAADATPYYDAQTRNYVGKVPIKERWSHECYDWKWEKEVASPESKGMKYKTIFFAKKMDGIDKVFSTKNSVLMQPILGINIEQETRLRFRNTATEENDVIYVPYKHQRIDVTIKCNEMGHRKFGTDTKLYKFLERNEGIKTMNLKPEELKKKMLGKEK